MPYRTLANGGYCYTGGFPRLHIELGGGGWWNSFSEWGTNPNNEAFWRALWGGISGLTVYTLPSSDSRVLVHPLDAFWEQARIALSFTVVEHDFTLTIPGPIWTPYMKTSNMVAEEFTSAEMSNIETAAKQYGGLLVSHRDGYHNLSTQLVEAFQPAWAAYGFRQAGGFGAVWSTAQGDVSLSTHGQFDDNGAIPLSKVKASTSGDRFGHDGPAVVELWDPATDNP